MIGRPFRRSALRLAAAAIVPCAAAGARGADVEYQTWFDYNAGWKTKSGLTLFGDAGMRRNRVDPRWWKYVLRPSVGYEFDLIWQQTGQLFDLYSDSELYLRVRVFQAF